VVFVHIATIEQGIASRDGCGTEDITKVRFINTKVESPSRLILDALLSARGTGPSQVDGYLHEVNSPTAVALAIRNGFADAGVCTSGIASSNGLSFVPIAFEDYELAVRREMLADQRLSTLVSLIRSPEFRSHLEKTGGYDTSQTGALRCLSKESILTDCPSGILQF